MRKHFYGFWGARQNPPPRNTPTQELKEPQSAFTEPAPHHDTFQTITPAKATFPPSLDKITLPILAKCPNYDHNSHLGRAKPHREGQNVTQKMARPVKDTEVRPKTGESLVQPGAGARIYAEGQDYKTPGSLSLGFSGISPPT